MNNQSPEMPFWDHLEELRWRLIKSIIAILIGAGFSYAYSDIIMYWLINPTESLSIDLNLQVLKITSMFTVKLSVALFGGMILGLPVILYQFWRFISPAFEDKYGLAVIFTVLFSSAFFLLGMSFAYFVIIPFSLAFFTSLTAETIDVAYNFTLEGYLMYILWLIFGCGLLFQLPVISIFFTKIGILTPAFLREYRKFAVVVFLSLGLCLHRLTQ
jgi:sec-independent protein translocase protein TatC